MFQTFEEYKKMRTFEETINEIKEKVSESGKLTQIAEECAEGAQAALKYYRALNGEGNEIDAISSKIHLIEELADISVCMDVFMGDYERSVFNMVYERKLKRWKERLNGRTKPGQDS